MSSGFDAMRSLTSQHLWVCRVGDDDMMIDGGMAEVETQKSRCVYTLWFMIHSCYDSCYSCCCSNSTCMLVFLLRYKMLNLFFLRVWTPKTQVYWSDFWRDTFPVTIWMFAALHCEGPEELIMCRHPEERPCVKENIQIFWATLYFWFLITSNYGDMFVHRIASYDAIWAYPRGTVELQDKKFMHDALIVTCLY